jgi:predicted nucleic-acid-binding protein
MKIIADTNVLLRAVLPDDDVQQTSAIETLKVADLVAVSVHSLCEFAWVLSTRYNAPRGEIAASIRRLVDTHKVMVNRPAVDAGLSVLDAGGDFADGVIAHDGQWLGGETFVSFDKKAVKLLSTQGWAAQLLL